MSTMNIDVMKAEHDYRRQQLRASWIASRRTTRARPQRRRGRQEFDLAS